MEAWRGKLVSGANARNAAVSIGGQAARFLVKFIGLAAISRILEPDEVGLAALALAIVGIAGIVGDFGLSLAAIAAPALSQKQSSNLFWCNLLIGACLATAMVFMSPLVAELYGRDDLRLVIVGLAPVFLLTSAGVQHRVLLTRSLSYRTLAVCEALAPLGGVTIGVICALNGAGVFALVIQELGIAVLLLAGYYMGSRWVPSPPSRAAGIRQFFGFSMATTATQIVNYVSTYMPQWILGAVFSPAAVGQFSRAFQILMLPIQQFAGPLTRVALPLLSRSDDAAFRESFHKVQTLLTYVLCIPLLVISILAHPIVLLALGPGWETAASILAILCVGGCFQSAGYALYWGFLARNKARELFVAEMYGRVPMMGLIVVGSSIGVEAVAAAFSAGLALVWLASSIYAGVKLPISGRRSFEVFCRGAGAGLAAYGVARVTTVFFAANIPTGVAPYVTLVLFLGLYALTLLSAKVRADLALVLSVLTSLRQR
ncbi:lipopolysaccharide biosynthesis protein [Arthrobacter sp. TMS1-12-1]